MLNLKLANELVDAALKQARASQFQAITVVVLDSGGSVLVVKREDGASFLRFDVARGKAWGALGMGMGSRSLAQRATTHPSFIAALGPLTDGRLVPVPGGVLIRDAAKNIVGAVGISGETSDNDEACAIAGIEAVGLIADPGVSPDIPTPKR
jgi:uncharacterized protein GlcG (DUF336 family)